MDILKKEIEECHACALCTDRINTVPGDGALNASVLIIGEAPGAKEEETGRPFVGRSGKLLMTLCEEIGLYRNKNLYITNTVKCRPPENRNPKSEEINACAHFLERQLDIIKPQVIILVGNFATKYYLDKKAAITAVHGKIFEKDGYMLFPVFHPAALLRNSNLLPTAREDFQTLKKILMDKNLL